MSYRLRNGVALDSVHALQGGRLPLQEHNSEKSFVSGWGEISSINRSRSTASQTSKLLVVLLQLLLLLW